MTLHPVAADPAAPTTAEAATTFKDHFSRQAADYAKFRPRYPCEMFEYLGTTAPSRELAWDCGTGNGQAAIQLAEVFDRVIATDASEKQIANAQPRERVALGAAPPRGQALVAPYHFFLISCSPDWVRISVSAKGLISSALEESNRPL